MSLFIEIITVLNQFHGWEPFSRRSQSFHDKKFPYLSWTQELTTGSYSMPDKPTPHPHTMTSLITILILSSHLCPHLATAQYCSDIPWVREQLLHCVLIIIKVEWCYQETADNFPALTTVERISCTCLKGCECCLNDLQHANNGMKLLTTN
jgi:hypothetical protein